MSSRRNFIKKTGLAGVALTATPSFGVNILKKSKPKEDVILGHGDYKYKLINDWAQISPVRIPLLNCHEMQMDSKGRLIMIGDHPKNNILIFDKSGKLLDYWGTAYPSGHGLTISNEGGEDFLFLTDSGYDLSKTGKYSKNNGRVSKTTVDGRVIFDIGHPQTIGVYKPGDHFCPTETAIGPNGDIYVADGYGMDYIIQYDYKGQYIRHWGGKNNPDKNYTLKNAHGVAIDYREKNKPMVVVTSRKEQCFKWYTLEGKYVKTLRLPNMSVCSSGVCRSQPNVGKTTWKDHTGFITILEGDKLVSNPGGTAPNYENGKLQKSYQLESKPILHGHDVCVDNDKNLYICQWNANKTAPIKLERV